MPRRVCRAPRIRRDQTVNPTAALTNALVLALTAPDQARADRAIALAESIGAGCTPRQIATAKRNASKLAAK